MEDENKVDFLETIEEIVIDFGRICRFCLTETDSSISILDKCLVDKSIELCHDTIGDFVTRLSRVKMNDLQNFPSLVCKNCYGLINICYNFSLACQQSDLSLRDSYQRTFNEAKEKLNFKELDEICDSTIVHDSGLAWKEKMMLMQIDSVVEESVLKLNEINVQNKSDNNKMKKEIKWKPKLMQKASISILKADNIKKKYQRINFLSGRLKEAQSKLEKNIVRSNDMKSAIVESEELYKILTDSNISSYSCPQCLLKYKSPGALKFHYMATHGQIKQLKSIVRFQCKKCIKTFSEWEKLIKHYEKIHNLLELTEEDLNQTIKKSIRKEQKIFYCHHCTPYKAFFTRSQLLNHLQEGHRENEKIFQKINGCGSCDSGLLSSRLCVSEHLKDSNGIKRKDIAWANMGCALKNEENSNFNLFKVFVCTDCFPPVSFTNVETCLKHKVESHGKQLEKVLPKGQPAVHVDSLDAFKQSNEEESNFNFKVFCRNCDPPVEFESANSFVNHVHSQHDQSTLENWNIETKPSVIEVKEPKKEMHQEEEQQQQQQQKWKCSECPSVYFRRHSLYYHMKEKHKKLIDSREMKCPDCGESFFTNRRLIQHGISTHQKYFAQYHKVFEKKILQPRGEIENRIKNFECDICQRKYVCKNSLKRHILKVHLGRAESERVACSYCGKTLSNKLNLKSHIEFVHEALFVSCPICKKEINFKTIGKHYKIHQSNSDCFDSGNQFLCNLCGKVLKSKRSFEDHQKLHKNIRDQLCDVCGSGFTTKKFLYLHKKIHEAGTKRKVFGCPQCEKVFSGRHTLNRHLLTHSGEKNFICEICSKCFYTLQELNRHVRYHKKEYRFDCQLCEMRFLDKSRFRHHMMRHRNIRPHKCQFCDKMFIVRRKMNLHMVAKHNVEVESTKSVWKDPKTYIPLDDLL